MLVKQIDDDDNAIIIQYPIEFINHLKCIFPYDKHLHKLADNGEFSLGRAIFDIILKEKPSLDRRNDLMNLGSRWASLSCVMEMVAISLCT
jgi:hypothetical protein